MKIAKADVVPTLQWLEKITNLPHEDFMLGTTGKKDTSGDLDVAVKVEFDPSNKIRVQGTLS